MRPVFLIRLALITGVATFAGVTFVLRSRGMLPEPDATAAGRAVYLRDAVSVLAVLALGWALFSRRRVEAAMTERAMNAALVVGWAPGEAVALLGIVTHFLGGPVTTMVTGLVAFLAVLLLLRIPTVPEPR